MNDSGRSVHHAWWRFANGLPFRQFGLLLAAMMSVCAYPVLFVYFHNVKEAVFRQVFSPILVFVTVAFVAWLVFGLMSGTMAKGALTALVFILVFMNYSLIEGSVRRIIPDWRWWRIAPTFLFLLVNLALALRVFVIGSEGNANLSKITTSIGLAFLALIVFNAAAGIYTLATAPRVDSEAAVTISPGAVESPVINSAQARPNFYFFLLDEYARQDVLKKYTGYDNTPFLKGLERKGFNVSYSSYSDSTFTRVSTGNLLHFRNIYKPGPERRIVIRRPPLLELFKKAGYKTYAYCPFYQFDNDLVDVALRSTTVLAALSIEKTLIARSFIVYLNRAGNEAIRADRLSLLKQAADVAEDSAKNPKFLFLQILSPHHPFVFDYNGDPVAYENMYNWVDTRHYAGQLCFLSQKIDELIDAILAQDPRAVVLLQSDHGARSFGNSNLEEWLASLNCVYLGGENVEIEGLSLINTLRLALNHALGLKLDTLED